MQTTKINRQDIRNYVYANKGDWIGHRTATAALRGDDEAWKAMERMISSGRW